MHHVEGIQSIQDLQAMHDKSARVSAEEAYNGRSFDEGRLLAKRSLFATDPLNLQEASAWEPHNTLHKEVGGE